MTIYVLIRAAQMKKHKSEYWFSYQILFINIILKAWPWRGCFTMSPLLIKKFLGGGGSIKNDNICTNKRSSNEETKVNIGFHSIYKKKLEAWPWSGCFTISPPLIKNFLEGAWGGWSIKND